ncbi:restriction endonuclease subunit S [Streptococcus parasanguinis]|uniref:restriction endonuclease subunit S n=1 Tax=Streptococcus parasanguinis TaxID=1318 RepID=UPI0039C1A81C
MINRNIPKIRFKEFINNWNNYKLGQLGNFKSGIGFPDSQQGGTEGIPFFKVSDMNNIGNETEMRNANNYVTQEQIIKNSWKVNKETPAIIFAKVGAALMLNRKRLVTRPFLIDNNTMSYSFDESWDKDFGLTLFQTINLPKYAQIGALPSYNASDIAMIKVNVPNVQEQSAIGYLFHTLDDLLVSYKDNLTNYKSLKATMLSKMFPKAGQTVPEIRLDGFEGEWKVVNLGRLIENYDEIISGASGFPIATSSRKGLYLQNDYFEGGRTGIDLTLDFHRVPMGYVTYRHMSDDSIFKFNKNNFETDVLVSKEYPVFISNNRSDIDFLLYHLNNSRLFLRFSTMQKLGGTRVRLYYKNLITYKLAVPTVEEQQAIGTYFSNLDSLITAHQEKISQLETLKKKLLQDMFI